MKTRGLDDPPSLQGADERSALRTRDGGTCRAVIDIGSNSIKLLVGHVAGLQVTPLIERAVQTRLGAGLYKHQLLQPEAIAQTTAAARAFCEEARSLQPASVRAIATAATREAANRQVLLDAIRDACGIEVEVISGEKEAAMAFRGVCSDPRFHQKRLLVIDVGGGSTEIVLGHSGQRHFNRSFPVGAVRLHERFNLSECPGLAELQRCRAAFDQFLETEVLPACSHRLADIPPGDAPLPVAVGGTVAVLVRILHGADTFNREMIDSAEISLEALAHWTERLWDMPLQERRRLPGLPPERADIILVGALIYEGLLRGLRLPRLRTSTRGLRFAALLEAP